MALEVDPKWSEYRWTLIAEATRVGAHPVALKPGTKFPVRKEYESIVYTPGSPDIQRDFREGRGWALILGNGLVDIDIETEELSKTAHHFLPPTPYLWGRESNPKAHRLYQAPNGEKTHKYEDPAGQLIAEIRTGSVMSTQPGTLHESGEYYEFFGDNKQVTIDQAAAVEYEELHQRLVLMVLAHGLREYYVAGARHNLAMTILSILAKHEFTKELCRVFMEGLCKVTQDEEADKRVKMVDSIFADVEADAKKTAGYKYLEELTCEEFKNWVRKTLRRAAPSGGIEKADLLDVAEYLADELGDMLCYSAMRDSFFVWQETHWVPVDSQSPAWATLELAVPRAMRKLGVPVTHVGALDGIKRLLKPLIELPLAPNRGDLVNFQNGTLHVKQWELGPHEQEHGFTDILPFDFSEGPTPAIDQFERETFKDPSAAVVLEEHVGLALLGDKKLQKALLLFGPGASGKTTAGNLACLACGEDPEAQPHADIFSDGPEGRNSRATWQHLLLAHISEFPAEAVRDGVIFKAMTAHGSVPTRQLYKVEEQHNAWGAKLLLTTNEEPRFADPGGAIGRRLLLLECPYGRTDAEMDPDLQDTLAVEIAEWAARCLKRAVTLRGRPKGRRKYSESLGMKRALKGLLMDADTAQGWAFLNLVVEKGVFSTSDDLYAHYKAEVNMMGCAAKAWPKVLNGIKAVFKEAVRKTDWSGKKQCRGVKNVRLRRAGDPFPDMPEDDPPASEDGPTEGGGLPRGEGPLLGGGAPPVSEGLAAVGEPPEGLFVTPVTPAFESVYQDSPLENGPKLHHYTKNETKPFTRAQAGARAAGRFGQNQCNGVTTPKKPASTRGKKPSKGVTPLLESVSQVYQAPIIPEEWEVPSWLITPLQNNGTGPSILALDTETAIATGTTYDLKANKTALDPHSGRLRLISLSDGTNSCVIDVFKSPGALEQLRPFIEDEQRIIVAHNASFDMKWLQKAGYDIKQNWADTMLMSQVLDGGLHQHEKGFHGLKGAVSRLLGKELDKAEQTSDWSLHQLSTDQLEYATRDAEVLVPLYRALHSALAADQLLATIDLEHRALPAIAKMELDGIYVDKEKWQALADKAQLEVNRLKPLVEEHLGQLNLNSPKQLTTALAKLGLHVTSTDEAHLKEIEDQHTVIPLLLSYRESIKQATTYGTAWLAEHVNPATGRVHAHFTQMVSTGRMSCSRPNLQNLPRQGYRAAFTASEDRALIKCDFSQLELRLGALISGDRNMLDAFNKGIDLHVLTASTILGISEELVTKEHRQIAKSLNFSLLFGGGSKVLKEYAKKTYGLNLTLQQATDYRNRWLQAYPGLAAWHRETTTTQHIDDAGNTWFTTCDAADVRTLVGRIRRNVSGFSQLLNTPIQGTGGDIIKEAAGRLFTSMSRFPGLRLVNIVHDEIMVECEVDQVAEVAAWLQNTMEEAMRDITKGGVPAAADVTVCCNWAGEPLQSGNTAAAA